MKIQRDVVVKVSSDPDLAEPQNKSAGVFRVRTREQGFRVRPKTRQKFFTPSTRTRIGIDELDPNIEYAFFKFFPNNGGFRIVVDSGAALQRSWRRALKREKPELFKASCWRRPGAHCTWVTPPTNRWLEVRLFPKSSLYFSVQPVHPKHYESRKTGG